MEMTAQLVSGEVAVQSHGQNQDIRRKVVEAREGER